jgi:transcriptional regulator with XRE-family HTH domain
MNNRTITIQRFSIVLNQALFEKYGRSPIATMLANHFNLRAHGTTTITRETARKWMRGLAIPEASKLKTLAECLDLDLGGVFKTISNEAVLDQGVLTNANSEYHSTLQSLVNDLDSKSKEAVLLTAWSLREMQNNADRNLDYQKMPHINGKLLGLLK